MTNVLAVQIFDCAQGGRNDRGSIMFAEMVPCNNRIKELSSFNQLKGQVVFVFGLEFELRQP